MSSAAGEHRGGGAGSAGAGGDARVVRRAPARAAPGALALVHLHLDSVDSTNAWARAAARAGELDALSLTAVTASAQTAGRGRGGRAWLSSPAGADITCTFAFRVPPAALPRAYLLSPLLSLVAARALQAALDDDDGGGDAGGAGSLAPAPAPAGGRARVSIGIKWPNDLVAGGARKVGGILCDLDVLPAAAGGGGGGGDAWVALGVGVNVNSTPAALGLSRPAWPASSLSAEAGRPLPVARLAASLVDAFAAELPRWLAGAGNFSPWLPAYAAASVVLGRRVRFADGARAVTGVAVGVAPTGGLLVEEEEWDGSRRVLDGRAAPPREFIAGEVTGLTLADGSDVAGGGGEPEPERRER